MSIPIHHLILDKGKELDLIVEAGETGLENVIINADLHRPGLALAGFLDVFSHDRVQVMGLTEIQYLQSLSAEERRSRLEAIFQFPIPCFIVTSGFMPLPELVEMANKYHVPLLRTQFKTSRFMGMISAYLEWEFAPALTVHGVFVDVFGEGVLIQGGSGVGKSEAGLELIERGHRLVADDTVVLKRLGKNNLIGCSARNVQHHMEVRGLGIVDVELLFGIGAVREEKRVSLAVELVKWSEGMEIDRLGMDEKTCDFLEVDVRKFIIPVESGRNVSVLVEVAALQHRIYARGRNPARELNDRLIRQMIRGKM